MIDEGWSVGRAEDVGPESPARGHTAHLSRHAHSQRFKHDLRICNAYKLHGKLLNILYTDRFIISPDKVIFHPKIQNKK